MRIFKNMTKKFKRMMILCIIFILSAIVMMILSIITQNSKFLFILPLGLGIMFLRISIGGKQNYSKWKDGKGRVQYIYTGTFDEPHSPTIVVEFADEEGKQHRGESQMFKEVNKYQSGDEIEFKYKLNESSTFKNIFGREGFARIHIFDDELQEYNSKPGDMILGAFSLFWIILALIMLFK